MTNYQKKCLGWSTALETIAGVITGEIVHRKNSRSHETKTRGADWKQSR